MIDKETWKIGTDQDKMEKLIKYYMHVQIHIKSIFLRLSQVTVKQFTVFSMNGSFKTYLDLIGKFKWIGKMMYNIIK